MSPSPNARAGRVAVAVLPGSIRNDASDAVSIARAISKPPAIIETVSPPAPPIPELVSLELGVNVGWIADATRL